MYISRLSYEQKVVRFDVIPKMQNNYHKHCYEVCRPKSTTVYVP